MARTAANPGAKPGATPRRPGPGAKARPPINNPTIFTKNREAAAKKRAEKLAQRAQKSSQSQSSQSQSQSQLLSRSQTQTNAGPRCRQCNHDTEFSDDGICMECGLRAADESNIVSEVQFGENSNGAAVVQGSYLGADQGGARSAGIGLRGQADEGQGRDAVVRAGRDKMQQLAIQLRIQENVVTQAVQILKLAVGANFIQGRRSEMVFAVCLYTACRMNKPCRVMLIDFADKTEPQCNVFKLGRVFKALHNTVTLNGGVFPVIPEDLIYRFAAKLDFGPMTDKVATDAVRLVRRMSIDWIVMGRRPSGICGACLILAARMHNFRRTITEVVYIVKVTTHTIQKRLDEFKMTPSSRLTVEQFLHRDFIESSHDPPSFYEQSEEFKALKASKKRKRRGHDALNIEDNETDNFGEEERGDGDNSSNQQKPPAPHLELRRDADGFAIPAVPMHAQSSSRHATQKSSSEPIDSNIDPELERPLDGTEIMGNVGEDDVLAREIGQTYNSLIRDYGDPMETEIEEGSEELEETEGPKTNMEDIQGVSARRRARERSVSEDVNSHVDAGWEKDELELETQMTEMVSDPTSMEHAIAYAKARTRLDENYPSLPPSRVSMDVLIGEDEFADDPEIDAMILSPEESKVIEKIWVNNNKDWLRQQQKKEFDRLVAAQGPPKARRNRKKKARMGEGHEPMSPGNATIHVLEKVNKKSKKLDYNKIHSLFGDDDSLGGSHLGSTTGTSRAGSESSSRSNSVSVRSGSVARSIAGSDTSGRASSVTASSDAGESEAGSVAAESVASSKDDWRAASGLANKRKHDRVDDGDDEESEAGQSEQFSEVGGYDDGESLGDFDVSGALDDWD